MMKSGTPVGAFFRRISLRDFLPVTQIALWTFLITASLVAVRGMMRSLHAPLGLQAEGAMLAQMDLGLGGYSGDAALSLERRMSEEVTRIPGVIAAGTISFTPLSGWGPRGLSVFRPGTVDQRPSNRVFGTRLYSISPDYFKAAETRLLTGRHFSWNDDGNAPSAAIVNQTFAKKLLGSNPAVGQRFLLNAKQHEIVGGVEDGKYESLTEDPEPTAFLPVPQYEQSNATLVVRSHLSSTDSASSLQSTLSGIVPGVPYTLRSWSEALGPVLFPARAGTMSLGILGLLAAMLAATGIFGMAAYAVSKSMKELPIRVALGAQPLQLMWSAVSHPSSSCYLVPRSAYFLVCWQVVCSRKLCIQQHQTTLLSLPV